MSLDFSKPGPKPCILCKMLLDSVDNGHYLGDWVSMQPNYGGEVKLIFGYGSTKFDNNPGATTFKGIVCDDCAEDLMERLQEIE